MSLWQTETGMSTCKLYVAVTGNSWRKVLVDRCSIQPLNLESLQGTSGFHDAVRMQQGLPWKHSTLVNQRQLTRLTLSTEDSSAAAQAFTGTHAAASSYDLLAVQPTSERVLQQVDETPASCPPKHQRGHQAAMCCATLQHAVSDLSQFSAALVPDTTLWVSHVKTLTQAD